MTMKLARKTKTCLASCLPACVFLCLAACDANAQDSAQRGTSSDAQSTPNCTISVECSALPYNIDAFVKREKAPYVPADGWLIKPAEVAFSHGESVYDALGRDSGGGNALEQ